MKYQGARPEAEGMEARRSRAGVLGTAFMLAVVHDLNSTPGALTEGDRR